MVRDSWHFTFTDRPPLTVCSEDLARAIVRGQVTDRTVGTVATLDHVQTEHDWSWANGSRPVREVFRARVQLDEWLAPVWYMHAIIERDIRDPYGEFIGTQTREIDPYIQRNAEPSEAAAQEWAWDFLADFGPESPALGPWHVIEATATEASGAYHLVTSW